MPRVKSLINETMVKEIVFTGEGEKTVRWNGHDVVLEAGKPVTVDADTADGLTSNHQDVVFAEGFSRGRANLPVEAEETPSEPVVVEEPANVAVPVEEVVEDEKPKKGKK